MTDFQPDPAPSDRSQPPVAPVPVDQPDDIWALARDLYSAGQTGQTVCRALGIPPSTFWRRAAHENWLRRDQPSGSSAAEPLDMTAAIDDLETARDKAWRRVCLAMDQGRSAEAMRWIRVHAALYAQSQTQQEAIDRSARGHAPPELERVMQAAIRDTQAELQRVVLAIGASDRLERVESTPANSHPAPSCKGPEPDPPGLSRAERRRRLKYRAASRPGVPPTDTASAAP